jgi:peptide/nickel transport system substrate-binding protein
VGRQRKGGTILGRHRLLVALLALLVGGAVLARAGSTARGQDGGILRVSFSQAAGLDYVDPALSFSAAGWSLLDATCARLYTYPDTASPGSFRLRPEVASASFVSTDLKTYTFTLRRGFRFSNGEPVRASAFARAINRVLQPDVQSPGADLMRDIVGAADVLAGRATKARGVVAHGNTLVVRFTRPAPNFRTRTALPFFCAVPPWLPPSSEGLGVFPSAGPYSVTAYRAGEGIVIRRNRYYGGERRVHLDGFEVDLRGGSPQDLLGRIERGEADWGFMYAGVFKELDFAAKYGLNGSRFRVLPGLTLRMFAFNTSRPLFRDNPRLRQAINFALDRRALVASGYGPVLSTATDQNLPPSVPGFRDAQVYPLEGDLDRASELARGNLRSGKAVLRVHTFPPLLEAAQLVKEQLARIGLEIEIKVDQGFEVTRPAEALRGEWDIAFVLWSPTVPDPYEYLSLLLDAHARGGETATRGSSRLAGAALARAARLPQGRARDLAYAEVDAMIARELAPVAVLSVLSEPTFVSERVGCVVLRPVLDLAVACLRK